MCLKRDRVSVRFASEFQDLTSDTIFSENKSVSSDFRLVFIVLCQMMMDFDKQHCLTCL